MPPKRMTANPLQPARYRAGKPLPGQDSSSEESSSEEEEAPKPAPPKVTSFRPKVQAKPSAASHTVTPGLEIPEGFETASEDESGSGGADKSGSGSGSEESSSEEEVSSSEEEVAPRKLVRPVFIKKTQRAAPKTIPSQTPEELEAHRKAQADAFLQETLERAAADKAAGKKHWDDEDNLDEAEFVDDTDPADPEAAATERAKWKLRELHRVKRERAMIEEAEAERAEVERRRNLSAAERDAEDREFLEKQKEEKGERGSMSFMQKYFHKGAFFQDDLKASGVDRRDLMGAKFEDATNREILPEYMQIRDMTKLGKKSRTKYRDMKSEDTGRWGDFERRGPRQDGRLDERFRPDGPEGRGPNVTGANSGPLGERKRGGELEDRGGKRPRVDDR